MLIEFESAKWKFGIAVKSYATFQDNTSYFFTQPTQLPHAGANVFTTIVKEKNKYYLVSESFPESLLAGFEVTNVVFTK